MSDTDVVQRLVGYLAALAFFVLAWQSMSPGLELALPVIAGTVIIVAMLLGKVQAIADLVDKWRNG